MSKVRLTVDVSPELNDILERIARETGSTKSEVFRKAVALIHVSHEALKEGKKVGVAEKSSDLQREFVGL